MVRDARVHQRVLEEITAFVPTLGWQCAGLDFSPIRGPEGNIEFLLYIVPAGAGVQPLHEYAISDTIRELMTNLLKCLNSPCFSRRFCIP